MKILFTCIGRRVELVQAFRCAAEKLNMNLEIFGTDMYGNAPALHFCDGTFLVPPIADPGYLPELQRICTEYGMDALIPTIDTDLLLLAENRDSFGKTKVIISAPEDIRICRDKRLTSAFFQENGLDVPKVFDDYRKYNCGFPAFIKPLNGSSSINAFRVDSPENLALYAAIVPDYIVLPFICGTEYTVDIFCGFDSKPIFITPRIRLAVRSGEVLKTTIDLDAKIQKECLQLLSGMKACGPVTVQLIREAETGKDYFIEINPRFGGGSPLSMKAGADSAEVLLRLLSGETALSYRPDAAENGALYARFDQSIRIR